MKAIIEKILASGGCVEIEAKQDDEGVCAVSVFARFGHIGRRAEGKDLESAFSSVLCKLAIDARETAEHMKCEASDISDMILEYECTKTVLEDDE